MPILPYLPVLPASEYESPVGGRGREERGGGRGGYFLGPAGRAGRANRCNNFIICLARGFAL